jgi:hypothetical protein
VKFFCMTSETCRSMMVVVSYMYNGGGTVGWSDEVSLSYKSGRRAVF